MLRGAHGRLHIIAPSGGELAMLRAISTHVCTAPAAESTTAAGTDTVETATKGDAFAARAAQVLGSLTHLSIKGMPEGYSQFFARGEGAHVWDVDGKEYIDFMCSYGPISVCGAGHALSARYWHRYLRGHPSPPGAARTPPSNMGGCLEPTSSS